MLLEELGNTCERLFREGRYTEAVSACEEILAKKLGAPARCNVLVLAARAYFGAKGPRCGQGFSYLKDALDYTEEGSIQRGQVLAALTAAYAGVGNVQACRAAREAFVVTNKVAASPILARLLPVVEYNLAVTYHELGRLDEATRYYTAATTATSGSTDEYVISLRPIIQHNLVDVFQENGEPEIARRIMEYWYNSVPEETEGARKRSFWAVQCLLEGDLASAVLWVESGLGHPACDQKARAALLFTKARIAQANQDLPAAQQWAEEAHRLAKEIENFRLCDRITAFLRQL